MKVIITVKGGIATVKTLPDNVVVEIRDYDLDDEPSRVKYPDEYGNEYVKETYRN